MSTYTQDINNLINIIETNIPDNTSQAIKAKNVRDAMESIAYNYDLYALKTDLDGKQDVLVSGENIKTINDASILGPGNIEISGGATLVECTQAEYEEMEQAGTLDPNAIYIITDAQPQNFVSKSELDAMSYITMSDVSACGYITTNDVSQMGYITSIPEEYATYDAISQMGYITNSALNGYATESYVVEKINEIPVVDLSSYVTKDYLSNQGYITSIPSEYITESELDSILSSYITESELDGMGYATQAYVMDRISEIPGTDLSSYVTKDYLSQQAYLQSIPSEYITESELNSILSSYITGSELNGMGYVTNTQLNDTLGSYITQEELSANGYLTQHQSLDGYATQSYVQNYVSSYGGTKVVEVTQAQYDAMEQAGTLDPDVVYIITDAQPQNVVTHTELEAMSYVTQEYLSNQGYITSIPDEYITQTELSANGYLTSIPSEYITDTELSGMGYLTQAQLSSNGYLTSIPSEYVTQTQLSANGYLTSSSLTDYATKSYVENYVASYAGSGSVVSCTQAQYDAWQQAGTLEQDTIYVITDSNPHDLSYYVEKTELYAMSYATQTYVADYVSEHAGPVDLTAYVTHDELNQAGYLTSIPSEYITQTELSANGYLTSIPSQYITETELSGMGYLTQAQLSSNGYLTSIPSEYVTQTELSANGYLTSIPSEYVTETELSGMSYATQTYVADYVASHGGTGGTIDMSSYVTHDFLSQQAYLQSIPSQYITETELNGMSYLTQTQLSANGYVTSADMSGFAKVHEMTYNQYNQLSYVDQHNGDIYVLTDRQYDFDPSYYVTVADLNAASYVSTSYIEANYYSKSYVDSNFVSKTYLESYYVSKTELTAAGYLTSANFDYDSDNNTLKIII